MRKIILLILITIIGLNLNACGNTNNNENKKHIEYEDNEITEFRNEKETNYTYIPEEKE